MPVTPSEKWFSPDQAGILLRSDSRNVAKKVLAARTLLTWELVLLHAIQRVMKGDRQPGEEVGDCEVLPR